MRKVEGVQSVKVSLKEGTTTLELLADNKVTLARLRTVIRNNGFVPKEVHIVARGAVRPDGFEVAGTGERLSTSAAPVVDEVSRWRFTVPAQAR